MKSKLGIFALLTLLSLTASSWGSVIYVSGDQTGTWAADTVIVTGEVRVLPGQSLTVMPGVEVLFSVYCKLIVDSAATLRAIGTPADSIRFDALPPNPDWLGIRFLSASDSSRLVYCHLTNVNTWAGDEDSYGAICCRASSPTISHSTLTGNTAWAGDWSFGGAIYCHDSNPLISQNIISQNQAYSGYFSGAGGGIYCDYSNPTIIGNIIMGNTAGYGGGICCYASSPAIIGNTINGNHGTYPGLGGGIYCDTSNALIVNNVISGNTATDMGPGGIFFSSCQSTLVNCIIWGNANRQIGIWTCSLQVTYSDIQDTLWPGVGNISVDPCFVNPDSGDYHLQSTVGSYHGGLWLPDPLHSPCIDAGDPGSPFDLEPAPNGGRVNMGFEGNTSEASMSSVTWASLPPTERPEEFCLHVPHPNPFNPTTALSYQLSAASHVNLRIYDTAGRLVATLVDGWREAGTHEVTFDGSNLASGVYIYCLEAGERTASGKMVLMR